MAAMDPVKRYFQRALLWAARGASSGVQTALAREFASSIGVKHPATPQQMDANTGWVFAANRQIAGRAARVVSILEMNMRVAGRKVTKTPVMDHPLLDLMADPNLD